MKGDKSVNQEVLKELEYISQSVGIPVEYTQGGGGNTSAKLDDKLMAVKASGFKLKQIHPDSGYVVLNYPEVKSYFSAIDLKVEKDYEKESMAFIRSQIVETPHAVGLRPSVEAGFHSILKKYVIHTHSVYANMLCCTTGGKDRVEAIFKDKPYKCAWIPYINPGFSLTLAMQEVIDACVDTTGRFPLVFFMENHGLVVTDDDSKACVARHQEVNETIKAALGLTEPFPQLVLEEAADGAAVSRTPFLKSFFEQQGLSPSFLEDTKLYPDQLVYLNDGVAVNGITNGAPGASVKLNIATPEGSLLYTVSPSEALTLEESLLAYVYLVDAMKRVGLPIQTMTAAAVSFIRNWESEAYRKSLSQKK